MAHKRLGWFRWDDWCGGLVLGLCVAALCGCGSEPSREVRTANGAGSPPVAVTSPNSSGSAETPTKDAPASSKVIAAAEPTPVKPSAKDWPRFRGPTGMGTSDAVGLPLTWSSTENVAWKSELPGPGASSPVVQGDRIYLTCYSDYFVPGQSGGSLDDLKRHLLALRRADGQIVWNKPVAAKLPEEKQIRDHGYAANTPAVDSERVYVFFGKSGV
ncbi:MAG: PQQ-binding-like beta-propeller repeat protein, partial [Planctomycetota bacterium]